jgi:hypothetical protein
MQREFTKYAGLTNTSVLKQRLPISLNYKIAYSLVELDIRLKKLS